MMTQLPPADDQVDDSKSRFSEARTSGPSKWTFLTNHAHVLTLLHAHPDMVLREAAEKVGITERAVQRIVQDLEAEGFLVKIRVGRRNHYETQLDRPLRHPIEAHRNIGELLRLFDKD